MKSTQFDDIYFSVEDGLAETQHTFLAGNHLPAAWEHENRFCIAETGFGTGLNMLAAWRLFEETSKPHQRLDLISIEKYPLSKDEIRKALAQWDLQPQLDRLLAIYPIRARGFHRLNLSPRVTLTLVFDDVLNALPQINAQVDAWFLDGFAPAKNPDMWAPALYAHMARLSHTGTSVATFTAAGEVRRGLQAAGFAVEKKPGFGRKRDMSVGYFQGCPKTQSRPPQKVAIIGAGLAGVSAAWHLNREGCDVTLYDAGGLAAGASGNAAGLVNPKLTAQASPHSAYYTSSYAYALQMLEGQRAGSLHLQLDADKARRFEGYIANLGWQADHMRLMDAASASDIAGVRLDVPCLHYPDALVSSPRDNCAALAKNIPLVTEKITDLKNLAADAIVLANGFAVRDFLGVPLSSVRGQVTRLKPNPHSSVLKTNLCYGGYVTPVLPDGLHMCGATFQPWAQDASVRDDDHARNLAGLAAAIPSLGDLDAAGGWVGFRAASKDRFPLVGRCDGLYVSAGHGSHGLSSSLAAGALLASMLCGAPANLPQDAITSLDPGRFGVIARIAS